MNWKRMRSSTFMLMAVIVISKLVGMARDVVLANYYGTTAVSDAYLVAVSVPTLLFYFIGHSLSTAYLPMYNKVKQAQGEAAANRYSNNLMCASLMLATVLVVLLLVFPEAVIKVFAAGFDADTTALAAKFVRISAASLYFMVIVNIWGGYLQTRENYLIPAAISLPRNAVIILSIVVAASFNINYLGLGLLLAYVAEFLLLLPFVLKNGYRIRPCLDCSDPQMRETIYLVAPILLGVAVSQINKVVDKSIASTLVEGGISALSYASVLNNAVQEVAVTGIITVLFANCAALVASGEHGKAKDKLRKTMDAMIFLLIPASVGIVVLAEPIIALLLQRGHFNQHSVIMTTSALRCYTVGLFFLAVRDALVKMFYAYKDTRVPAATSIAAILVNIGLNFLFSRFWGLSGLALATSVAAILQCGALWTMFHRKYQKLDNRHLIPEILQTLGISILMGVIVYHTFYWISERAGNIWGLCTAVGVGIVVYVTANLILNKQYTFGVIRSIFN